MINQLTTKGLKSSIKRGFTEADFCEKYGCSSEEFEAHVSHLYCRNPRDAKKCLDDIRANAKKARKTTGVPEDDKKPAEVADDKELDELKAAEELLSRQTMDAEHEYYARISKHREFLNKLRSIRKDIEEMRIAFRQKFAEYEQIATDNNCVVDEVNEALENLRSKKNELQEIRNRIDELQKVTLNVYASGEIAVDEGSENQVDLNDSGYMELYEELIEKEECQELRLREVKVLARLLKIVENGQFNVELICDNKEIETVFRLLSDAE